MQTLKNILARKDERFNLQNGTICVLAVLFLVVVALGVWNVDFFVQMNTDTQVREPAVTAPR